jgi:tetratricopeptide (TPR) repeat protein
MPTNDELYDEADKLREAGQLEESVVKYKEILAADPNYALAHSALAVVLGKLGRHSEAIEHGLKVCQLEPNDAFTFTAMSVTFQRAGKIMEAEEAMARARMLQQGMH